MTLDELFETVKKRASSNPDESWTAKLMAKGPEKCAQKFAADAVEANIEAGKNDPTALTSEAADVIFHLMVMLHARGVEWGDVVNELARRQGQSGIAEKASRG